MTPYQKESEKAGLIILLSQLKTKIYQAFNRDMNINIIDRNLKSIEKQINKS